MANTSENNIGISDSSEQIFTDENLYKKFFHNSPIPKTLSNKLDRKLIDVNQSWERFTGYKKDEVIGYKVEELNLISNENALSIRKQLGSNEILSSLEVTINKKDNTKVYGLATFQFIEENEESYVLASILDISDLKTTERELSQAKHFTDRLLDCMHESIFILDKDLNCIRVNKAYSKLTGYREKDVVGTSAPFPHWPPEEAENIKAYVQGCLKGDLSSATLKMKRSNGERFEVYVATTKITDLNSEVIGYVTMAIDISERVKYQNELIEKSKKATKKKEAILSLLSLLGGNFDEILEEVTSLCAEVMEVNRVSIWEFKNDETEIQCLKAYNLDSDKFKNHISLDVKSYPNYFKELYKNKSIVINDTSKSDFNEDYRSNYIDKFGITAMLDVFIKGINNPFGILCFEETQGKRKWTPEEEQFAVTIAGLVSLVVENIERTKIEKNLKKANAELENLKRDLEKQNSYLREEIDLVFNYEEMVYGSAAFSQILTELEKVADTDATVLLYGETGTGKELLARAVHNISGRKSKPLIKVNCAAIPRELIESELFGHKKGSFTGAFSDKVGKFKLADGGTLFLDEIGELPLEMQPKLLRAIQELEIEPVGSSEVHKVDIRIVAATNRKLEKEVENKTFRQDLYFRLNVFPIKIPPLRDRPEDIPILIEHFVNRFSKKYNKQINCIPQATRQELHNYQWPGNIRELENLMERSVILSNTNSLHVPGFKSSQNEVPLSTTTQSLEEVQKNHIERALHQCNWKISGPDGASKLLKINPSTLRDRMKKFGIKKP